MMKPKLTIATLAALAMTALAACSAMDDADALAMDSAPGDYAYDGQWAYSAASLPAPDDKNSNADPGDEWGQQRTTLTLLPQLRLLIIDQMPTSLFLALAGLQATSTQAPPYSVGYEEKGYSRQAEIYAATLPPYVFTASSDGQQHSVSVEFRPSQELLLNYYLNTLTLTADMASICVDGGQKTTIEPGTLVLSGERH